MFRQTGAGGIVDSEPSAYETYDVSSQSGCRANKYLAVNVLWNVKCEK
jgi:hypothetical protein